MDKGGVMSENRNLVMLAVFLFAAGCFFGQALAVDQSQVSRDRDAIIQRKINRMTQEQRKAAAVRAQAAHEAANPALAVLRKQARKEAGIAAAARAAALRNTGTSSDQSIKETLKQAVDREAAARNQATRASGVEGGRNE